MTSTQQQQSHQMMPAQQSSSNPYQLDEPYLSTLSTPRRLQHLTKAIVQAMSDGDYDFCERCPYLSPTFRVRNISTHAPNAGTQRGGASRPWMTRSSCIEGMKKVRTLHPRYRIEILSTCAEVDEEQGYATVWMTLRAPGLPWVRLAQEVVSRVIWVYKGKHIGWVCAEYVGIRGGCAFVPEEDVV